MSAFPPSTLADPPPATPLSPTSASPAHKSPPRSTIHKNPSHTRLPPPALFQAPPSPNTSTLDLPGLTPTHTHMNTNSNPANPVPAPPKLSKPTPSFAPATVEEQPLLHQWSEMQKALLNPDTDPTSASSTTTRGVGVGHVFGAAHGAALERLREAQVKLAGAWRSGEVAEGSEVASTKTKGLEEKSGDGEKGDRDAEGDAEVKGRREANDVYFEDVNRRVVEVVRVLGEVEGAMRGVEREGREIWRDKDKDKDKDKDGEIEKNEEKQKEKK